ncbi:hypothetical protein ILUMI_07244 [Ignelater luminosus]|uniref:Transmembrane protein 135 N-terminal domain-containing protein n=1 Tax=Ignelater luminosus TaxID=2038154 RepID=A0A8K0DDW5_IGNLU|nr:hypothetical protein ILUMI_07244 [Ignelater luminosus]
MVQIQSKLVPISATCTEYAHPWTDSCFEASLGCYLYGILGSFKMYTAVYVLALLIRAKIPTKKDLKKTIYGIFQSTAFLSGTAVGYPLFMCSLRRLLGNFNILTASGIPAFLASVFAILIERPSRRVLLSLYVSNVATETLWNMALARNMVHPIKYGEIAIFSLCITTLLYYYKSGLHKKTKDEKSDSMFGVLRFVVGPYEEKDCCKFDPSTTHENKDGSWSASSSSSRNTVYHLVMQALGVYKRLIYKIKYLDRYHACLHPFSCLYYTMQGAAKMFGVSLGIQVILKLVLNMRRIIQSPKMTKTILFRKDILSLAVFLGGFSGIFRGLSCVLRRATGRDSPYHAIPAGLLAGIAFKQYPDTTLALYVLWKMAQITYNLGIDRGILPKVPGFTIFLHSFSTAILFHAALLEPTTLRPSYWKFLHSLSGGRIAHMNRNLLDVWGLETSQGLIQVLKQTNTVPVIKSIGGCA